MPKHKIEVRLPARALLNSDASFLVHSDGTLLGELTISKGTIDWRPAKRQKPVRLSWERFARLIEGTSK